MAEAAGAPTLRRLVPRIFSRSQTSGGFEKLLKTVRKHHPKSDLSGVERAYQKAKQAHDGQLRRSGEPYITRPAQGTRRRAHPF